MYNPQNSQEHARLELTYKHTPKSVKPGEGGRGQGASVSGTLHSIIHPDTTNQMPFGEFSFAEIANPPFPVVPDVPPVPAYVEITPVIT